MRIVTVEDFFHPDAGYQLNILSKYWAKQGHEVIVITSEMQKMPGYLKSYFGEMNIEQGDSAFEQQYHVKIIRLPIKKYISGRSIYYNSIFRTIDNLSPDILYIHGVSTYLGIRYVWKTARLKYPTIFDNHMVEMASHNKFAPMFYFFFTHFVSPIIRKNGSIVIQTAQDDFLTRKLKLKPEQCPFIGFGSDTLLFYPDKVMKRRMREELSIPPEARVFIYAGKLDEFKDGKLLARTLQASFATNAKIYFVVIGNTAGEYGEEVKAILAQSQNQIISLPTQPYTQLHKYFKCADVALFAKECSLTFFDVQACGLPVIMENNHINMERVMHNNGACFKRGDLDDFRLKINSFIQMDSDTLSAMSENAVRFVTDNYNYEDVAAKYMQQIQEAYDKFVQ